MSNPFEALVSHVAGAAKSTGGVLSGLEKDTVKVLSFMEALEKPALVVVDDIMKYTPDAVHIANVLLPEYSILEDAAGAGVVDAMQVLKNGIILVQQANASLPKTAATNDAKKAQVMADFAPSVIALLTQSGIKTATTTRVGNMVDAIVQMLNSNVVPVTA
jgi:hypothetical protein